MLAAGAAIWWSTTRMRRAQEPLAFHDER